MKHRTQWLSERCRLQFNLRAALVGIGAIGLVLGLVADRAHRQQAAIRAFRRNGIEIAFKGQYDSRGHGSTADYVNPNTAPSSFIDGILGEGWRNDVAAIWIRVPLTDENVLKFASDCPSLRSVYIDQGGRKSIRKGTVSNEGLLELARARSVECIAIYNNPLINDSGICALSVMPRLTRLSVDCPNITGKALECLAKMKQLEEVEINGRRLLVRGRQ